MTIDQLDILPLETEHADAIAELHIRGIAGGFISSLGPGFVRCLYRGIAQSDRAFGFVAIVDGDVAGYISCAESVGAVYKYILRKHFFRLSLAVLPKLLRFRTLKHALETLLYPSRAKNDLPAAEVLAIVVDDSVRGRGVGRALMQRSCDEFHRRGVEKVKVMVGKGLPANAYYEKLGFELTGHYEHHGAVLNCYVRATS